MQVNPIDGRCLAKQICDQVAREHQGYLAGQLNAVLPKRKLTYPEELALFKALQEEPANKDVRNAFTHCYAQLTHSVMRKVYYKNGVSYQRLLDPKDTIQAINLILSQSLEHFEPARGTRFISYFAVGIKQQLYSAMFNPLKLRPHGPAYARPFFAEEGNDPEVNNLCQHSEPAPEEALMISAKQDLVRRLFTALTAKQRVILKLRYGIRFEGEVAVPWELSAIAKFCGYKAHQNVSEVIKLAFKKMKEMLKRGASSITTTVPLDDGDIFLATQIGLSPDSHFFPVFCNKGSAWLRKNRQAVQALIGQPKQDQTLSEQAKIWTDIDKELQRSALSQRKTKRAQLRRFRREEGERYQKFRRLVTDYIYGESNTVAQSQELLHYIVAFKRLRAPVRTVMVTQKKEGQVKKTKRRILKLSETRKGKQWRAYHCDFRDTVYIIPTIVAGSLNIEVRNHLDFGSAPYLYNSSWDAEKGVSVSLAAQYAEFFEQNDQLSVPKQTMAKRACLHKHGGAYVNVFKHKKLYFDSRHAAIDIKGEDNIGRAFWFSAFGDDKGKGVTVQLRPDGPELGRAYYLNGEFVPEPGPLLRSRKQSVMDADKGCNLIARLRTLSVIKESSVVVKRNIRKSSNTLSDGGKKDFYYIDAFQNRDSQTGMVTVDCSPGQEHCYVKFLPADSAFEIYPTEKCSPKQRIMRRFYDLEGLAVFTPREELKNRFNKFLEGESVNPLVANVDAHGKIYLTDTLLINAGWANRGRPYFIVLANHDVAGLKIRRISLYQFNKGLAAGGRPVRIVRCLEFSDDKDNPVLEEALYFSPYQLVGTEKILIQELTEELGYTAKRRKCGFEQETLEQFILDKLASGQEMSREVIVYEATHRDIPEAMVDTALKHLCNLQKITALANKQLVLGAREVKTKAQSPKQAVTGGKQQIIKLEELKLKRQSEKDDSAISDIFY
ncbi:MAG: sigma-70 family RNA polymerase sigma factor, partial [Candidatus Omnitrophica bacterium]|nr:sigma-70 family RNA polymerase sigma factor [Candidatus Omnitrophota bacterium]